MLKRMLPVQDLAKLKLRVRLKPFGYKPWSRAENVERSSPKHPRNRLNVHMEWWFTKILRQWTCFIINVLCFLRPWGCAMMNLYFRLRQWNCAKTINCFILPRSFVICICSVMAMFLYLSHSPLPFLFICYFLCICPLAVVSTWTLFALAILSTNPLSVMSILDNLLFVLVLSTFPWLMIYPLL
jgi:hypothetical protein